MHLSPWLPTAGQEAVLRADALLVSSKWPLPGAGPWMPRPSSWEGISCAQAPPYGNEGHAAGTPARSSTQAGDAGKGPSPPRPAPRLDPAPISCPAPCSGLGKGSCLTPKAHIFGVPLEDMFLDLHVMEC